MKHLFTILILAIAHLSIGQEVYQKVKIYYTDKEELHKIVQLAELDHFNNRKNQWIVAEIPQRFVSLLQENGFQTEVEIEDLKAHIESYTTEGKTVTSKTDPCQKDLNIKTPENYRQGSMAGFLTYDEVMEELDKMHRLYPHLITERAPIDTFKTHENRVIYHLRMSDNPDTDEGENTVLYTALHHAREPGSMQQTIFFMWYLLENYETDPEIKALIDTTELYFVPVVNPDGFIFNCKTNPNGGGYWRKNRRNHGDGNYGVDNNRNYAVGWGTTGISTNTGSDVHCGPSAFSEPENQAIRWLCNEKNFKAAFNAHTHGSLMLYPYGYAIDAYTEDDAYFKTLSDEIVKYNGYKNQKATDLYPASGDSDDWMYDPTETKPKIIAFTPEVGSSFYDNPQKTLINNQNMIHPNMTLLRMIHTYGIIKHDISLEAGKGSSYKDKFRVVRLGYDAGDLTVRIKPLSSNIASAEQSVIVSDLELGGSRTIDFELMFSNTITNGDDIQYELIVDNGIFPVREVITQYYGDRNILFHETGDSTSQWTVKGRWDTYQDADRGSVIADSPAGLYRPRQETSITLNETYSIPMNQTSILSYWARWDIEFFYDFAQLQVSTDKGATWEAVCGQYTSTGSPNQDENQPIYDGTQSLWVKESISLQDYRGKDVTFRFRLVSDEAKEQEGFFFDDFSIATLGSSVSTDNLHSRHTAIYPMPVQDEIHIRSEIEYVQYTLYSAEGKKVSSGKVQEHRIPAHDLPQGIYMLKLEAKDKEDSYRIVIE